MKSKKSKLKVSKKINRTSQKGGNNNNNNRPSFESRHGKICSKKNNHKILKTRNSNNLICKKSYGIGSLKFKTTLTKNGKPRYFHRSNKTKKCANKYCWHRLSRINKSKYLNKSGAIKKGHRYVELSPVTNLEANASKPAPIPTGPKAPKPPAAQPSPKPKKANCLAKKGWFQRNNDCWLDSALWALFYSDKLEKIVYSILDDMKGTSITVDNYVDELIKYVNSGLTDTNWSKYNKNCIDDRASNRKMSCKQKSKNKISQYLFLLSNDTFFCSPEDCTEDQDANDPTTIFQMFQKLSNRFKIIEMADLKDRKLSNIKNTSIDFENKDIIVVRKLTDGTGDGSGNIDTNINNIRDIINNDNKYHLVSIEKSSGPVHYVAGSFCDEDNSWYHYDNQASTNLVTEQNSSIKDKSYLEKQTVYLIYLNNRHY